jgi:drug/metabolite transporter (DMT)-like permease
MLSWAFYTLVGRRVVSSAPNTVVTGAVLGIGTVLLLPSAAYEWFAGGFPAPSLSGVMSLLFLGLGGSGASFLLWNRGLQHLKAGEATAFINLIPLVGVLSAVIFLDETIRWIHLVSGVTVLFGVYLASFDQIPKSRRAFPAKISSRSSCFRFR